eukprot:s129_g34.t1
MGLCHLLWHRAPDYARGLGLSEFGTKVTVEDELCGYFANGSFPAGCPGGFSPGSGLLVPMELVALGCLAWMRQKSSYWLLVCGSDEGLLRDGLSSEDVHSGCSCTALCVVDTTKCRMGTSPLWITFLFCVFCCAMALGHSARTPTTPTPVFGLVPPEGRFEEARPSSSSRVRHSYLSRVQNFLLQAPGVDPRMWVQQAQDRAFWHRMITGTNIAPQNRNTPEDARYTSCPHPRGYAMVQPDDVVTCPFAGCGYVARNAQGLQSHINRKHPAETTTWKCDHCDRTFKQRSSLTVHLESCGPNAVEQELRALHHALTLAFKFAVDAPLSKLLLDAVRAWQSEHKKGKAHPFGACGTATATILFKSVLEFCQAAGDQKLKSAACVLLAEIMGCPTPAVVAGEVAHCSARLSKQETHMILELRFHAASVFAPHAASKFNHD